MGGGDYGEMGYSPALPYHIRTLGLGTLWAPTPPGERDAFHSMSLVLQVHELTPNSVPATLTRVLQPGPDVSTKPQGVGTNNSI